MKTNLRTNLCHFWKFANNSSTKKFTFNFMYLDDLEMAETDQDLVIYLQHFESVYFSEKIQANTIYDPGVNLDVSNLLQIALIL